MFKVNGALAANWALPYPGLPVVVEGGLTVSEGTTLSLAAGATMKFEANAQLTVNGMLNAEGTSASPVRFGANEGEWACIYVDLGREAKMMPTVRFDNVTIADAKTALDAGAGTVAIRGDMQFESDGRELIACGWGEGCSVDAAYTYWGSVTGPVVTGEAIQACGAVTTSPYLTMEASGASKEEQSVFESRDCGSTQTLPEAFTAEQVTGQADPTPLEELCHDNHEEEACEELRQYDRCMAAAVSIADSSNPFTVEESGKDLVEASASFISKAENTVVSMLGEVASFGLELIDVAQTIRTIGDAYDSCDP